MKDQTISREGRPTGLRGALTLEPGETVSPEFYAKVSTILVKEFMHTADEKHLAKDGLATHEVHNNLECPDPLEETALPATVVSFAGQDGKVKDGQNNFRSDEEHKTNYEIKTQHTYNISVSVECQSAVQAIRLSDYLFRALLDYSVIAFQHVQASRLTVKAPGLPKAVDKSKKHFAAVIIITYTVDLETRVRSQETPVNTVEIR